MPLSEPKFTRGLPTLSSTNPMLDPATGRVRKLRRAFNDPGHAHELTFSCHQRLPLLSKDRTRRWFIESLDAARRKWEFDLWAWVIMPEHVHVLLFPRFDDYDVSSFLKSIKQPVGRPCHRVAARE